MNKVYVEKADLQANCSFDFGAFNSFSQQMSYGGQPYQQPMLNGLDEICATGGFNPNKYMAPQPMMPAMQMQIPNLPEKETEK